jgi:hypothetical protein
MSALNKFYKELGEAKSRELYEKYNTLWSVYGISKVGTRSKHAHARAALAALASLINPEAFLANNFSSSVIPYSPLFDY